MRSRVSSGVVLSLISCCFSFGQANPAGAPKWELEIHGGSLFRYRSSGLGVLPPPGADYVFFIDPVLAGSRRESSWFFGDGTALFNRAAFVSGYVPQIVPLDPILRASAAKPQPGTIGFRLSRKIRSRFSLEFTLERGGKLALTDSVQPAVAATRDSYKAAFLAVTRPQSVAGPQSAIDGGRKRFLFSTGSLVIDARPVRGLQPFVSIGAGIVHVAGRSPSVLLAGAYDPSYISGVSDIINDTASATYTASKHLAFAPSLGLGVKIPLNRRWGIRAEVRAYSYHDPTITSLTAAHTNPKVFAFIASDSGGPAFWRTIPPGILVGAPPGDPVRISSLTGPPISGFQSFTERGIQRQFVISGGPFWRF